MEVTVKVMVSKKGGGYIRFYGSVSAIPSSVVRVSTFVELVAEYRIYCRMIKEFGYTVDVRRPNLYSAFVNSRPQDSYVLPEPQLAVMPEGNPEYKFGFTGWQGPIQKESSVLVLDADDKDFLKSLHISAED